MDNYEEESNGILDLSNTKLDLEELKKVLNKVKNDIFYGDIIWGKINPKNKEKDLIIEIEDQLIENNKHYSQFPSDFTHGMLCNHLNKQNLKKGDTFRIINTIWEVVEIFFQNSFIFATLLADNRHKHLVLVFKTYEFSFTILNQDLTKSNSDAESCQRVTKKTQEIAKEIYKSYNLSFTGYLNAAWLAELSSFYFNNYNLNIKLKTVLFDGPGIIKPNQNNLFKNLVITNKKDSNVVNYLTSPNIFNTFNKHQGKIFKINTKEINSNDVIDLLNQFKIESFENESDIKKRLKYSRFFYSGFYCMFNNKGLESILDEFDSITGKPFECLEASKWPYFDFKIENEPLILKSPNIQHKENPLRKIIKKKPHENKSFEASPPPSPILLETYLRPNPDILIHIINELIQQGIDFGRFQLEKLNSNQSLAIKFIMSSFLIKCDFRSEYVLSKYDNLKLPFENAIFEQFDSKYKKVDNNFVTVLNDFNLSEVVKNKSNVFISFLKHMQNCFKIVSYENKKFILSNYYSIDFIYENFCRLNHLDSKSQIFKFIISNQKINIRSRLPNFEDNFVGRRETINKVLKWFENNNIVILCGESGDGKYRLAVELGYHFMTDHVVKVIHSESVEEFEIDYCEFASNLLNIDSRSLDIDMLINLVNLKIKESSLNFFFILNNVEDLAAIDKFINNLPKPKVKMILTTNLINLTADSNLTVPIEVLRKYDSNEAIEYFKRNLNFDLTDKIPSFFKMPLEFYLGVRYINLDTKIAGVFDEIMNETSIYKVMFKRLKKESEETFNIFANCSLLDADAISFDLLKKLVNNKNLSTHLMLLKKLGLIGINFEESFISVNRLIQKKFISFLNIDYVQTLEYLANTLYLMIKNDPKIERNKEFDYFHLKKILNVSQQHNIPLNSSHEIMFKIRLASFNFHIRHNYNDALKNYTSLFNKMDIDDEVSLVELSEVKYNLALCYMKLEKYDIAISHHEEALLIRKDINEKDPFQFELLAESFQALGDACFSDKKYEQSFNYYNESLKLRDKFQIDKSETLVGLGNYHAYKLDYKEALSKYLEAYEINKQKQIDVSKVANHIGCIYDKLGQYATANSYYLEAYHIRNKLYKFDHTDLIESVFKLATSYNNIAEYTKALEFHKKAYFMRKRLYSVPYSMLVALASSIDFFKKLGINLIKVEMMLFDEILDSKDVVKFIHENKHPRLAESLNSIGLTLSYLQKDDLAVHYVELAYNIRVILFKEPHYDLVESLNTLAIIKGKKPTKDSMSESIKLKIKAENMKSHLK